MPDRDGLNIAFSQLVLDYWSSFVRTGSPNPDPGYLRARVMQTPLNGLNWVLGRPSIVQTLCFVIYSGTVV